MPDRDVTKMVIHAAAWFFCPWVVAVGFVIWAESDNRLSSPGWRLALTLMNGDDWGLVLAACGATMMLGLVRKWDRLVVWGARGATLWFGVIGMYAVVVLPQEHTANVASPMLWLGWTVLFFAASIVYDTHRGFALRRTLSALRWVRRLKR